MQVITLGAPTGSVDGPGKGRIDDALAGIVAAIGVPDFGNRALACLAPCVPAWWLSVYRLLEGRPPTLHVSSSLQAPDGCLDGWRSYVSSLHLEEDVPRPARDGGRPGSRLLMHRHAHEFSPRHRELVYRRHGLCERLSIVVAEADGSLLTINLYRHESQPPFTPPDIEALAQASGLLTVCVQRHLAATPQLQALAGLTVRERDVCVRMLRGWTHDGIAADMGVTCATVKTYRNRAFERLGIHHRNELFALMIRQWALA